MNSLSLGKEKIIYDRDNITQPLKEFNGIYKSRPISDNSGGMSSSHLFNTWYALKQLNPKLIIESGVWKGLGTWLIEKAVPTSKVISIDIDYSHLEFKSPDVLYFNKDIKTLDWENILNKQYSDIKRDKIVVFLDDHQNFLDRLEFLYNLGIKHVLYEDNYPSTQGDAFSPKKILSCQDYIIDKGAHRQIKQFSYADYDKFLTFVKTYQELPPIFKLEKTRWGDRWDNKKYLTEKALLPIEKKDEFNIFYEEAGDYTWICYLELK